MKLTPISGQGTSSWQSDGDPTELHEKHLGIVAEKKFKSHDRAMERFYPWDHKNECHFSR